MLKGKTILTAIAAIAVVTLGGCATGTPAEPHQHMRDAKQGTTLPAPAADQPVAKPLHNHREMK